MRAVAAIVKSPASRSRRVAGEHARGARIGDDSRVELGVVGCRDRRAPRPSRSRARVGARCATAPPFAASRERKRSPMCGATTKIGNPAARSDSALRAATLPPPTITARRPFGRREMGSIRTQKEFRARRSKTAFRAALASFAQGPARAAIVGAVVAALVTLPGLGVGTLWDNSETAYGEVAREILLTHNWVVMHLNGVPYFVQPPLYFWARRGLSRCSSDIRRAFALRLPSALATIALSALTGYAVARQAGTRVGAYAAVILSTCLMQAVIGRLAIMDALLDLAVAMTIFWWFRGLETGRDRYVIYGWIAAGGGFLAKGLVAPAIALLVIVPFYLWNRRYEPTCAPSARAWIVGLVAFVAIVAPWPIALVVALPLLSAREADRRVHDRPLHRRRRESVRARYGTTCRSSSSASSRGSRFCRWPSSTRVRAAARRRRAGPAISRGSCASRLRMDRDAACCSSASHERSCRTTSRSNFRRWP